MQHHLKPRSLPPLPLSLPRLFYFQPKQKQNGKNCYICFERARPRARTHTATHAHRWVPSNDAEPITLHASCSVFRTEITPTTVTAAARFPRSHTVRPGSRKATHTLPVIIIFLKASHEIERW